mmetsp:Transcript_12681/g.12515  ORF Transcript_12681/g.12515 Transcript_12681/m.12515 type:complete len:221 (-) Transcript_12681:635-1297(-)
MDLSGSLARGAPLFVVGGMGSLREVLNFNHFLGDWNRLLGAGLLIALNAFLEPFPQGVVSLHCHLLLLLILCEGHFGLAVHLLLEHLVLGVVGAAFRDGVGVVFWEDHLLGAWEDILGMQWIGEPLRLHSFLEGAGLGSRDIGDVVDLSEVFPLSGVEGAEASGPGGRPRDVPHMQLLEVVPQRPHRHFLGAAPRDLSDLNEVVLLILHLVGRHERVDGA